MEAVKAIFDGYDVGVRYADDALGSLLGKLDDLDVLDETAVLVSTDHGEAFGELGVYADHQAADEATSHIPAVLRWPGVGPRVHQGLQYHLDIAATVLDLAGLRIPRSWDGAAIDLDRPTGRDHLVLSQGAWSCQRSVRFGDHLYLRTWHDGYHGHWPDQMLFDVARDPHETNDIFDEDGPLSRRGASLLDAWTSAQLERTGLDDPMDVVRTEGGPFHVRGRLGPYLERLRSTGRGGWARILVERHSDEL
jgi:arylsulfatase A-like enzyme